MKTFLTYLIILFTPYFIFSQEKIPTKAINGTYHLLKAERSSNNKSTKIKFFEYGDYAGIKVLGVASCQRCMPAMYRYMKEDSESLGFPFFFNKVGLFMITYDINSFVMIMFSDKKSGDWSKFSYSNFYSKDITKVNSMTEAKIKEFILKISEE